VHGPQLHIWANQIFWVPCAAVKILWQKFLLPICAAFLVLANNSRSGNSCISKYLRGVWQSPTWRLGQIVSVDDVFTATWISCDKLFRRYLQAIPSLYSPFSHQSPLSIWKVCVCCQPQRIRSEVAIDSSCVAQLLLGPGLGFSWGF